MQNLQLENFNGSSLRYVSSLRRWLRLAQRGEAGAPDLQAGSPRFLRFNNADGITC